MPSVAVADDGSECRRLGFAAAWLAPTPRNLACWGALVFIVSLGAFLWGIEAAPDLYFDETWYVPTARTWLQSGQMLHQEHPPLAKLLIGVSLWLFGDNPLGWRAMSALFGAITMVAMGLWSFALLGDLRKALWTCAITFFDAIVFVQAQIAMLDIYLMAFCVAALAFFTLSMKDVAAARRIRAYPLAMGASLGFAGACKLSGFFLWFGLLAIVGLIGLLRLWRVRFDDPRRSDFYAPEGPRMDAFQHAVGLRGRALPRIFSDLRATNVSRRDGLRVRCIAPQDGRHSLRPFPRSSLYESLVHVAGLVAAGLVSLPCQGRRRLAMERPTIQPPRSSASPTPWSYTPARRRLSWRCFASSHGASGTR